MAAKKEPAKLPETRVESISRMVPATLEGCTVVVTRPCNGRGRVFIKAADGRVFTTGPAANMASSHGANDTVRRAWCRLAGVKFADLKAAMRSEREREQLRQSARELAHVQAMAARLGLKVIKPRKAKA